MIDVGLFVGISSGAIMAGAVRCAAQIPDDVEATIVTIACDDGWKYLSTGAWTDDLDVVVERAKKIIYFSPSGRSIEPRGGQTATMKEPDERRPTDFDRAW